MTIALPAALVYAGLQGPAAPSQPAGAGTLALLASITLALIVVACIHAGAALLYRRRTSAHEDRFQRLTASWNPEVVAFLFGGREAEEVQRLVAPDEHLLFVNALLQFSRRVSGPELDGIRVLAIPFLPSVVRRLESRSPGVRARAVQTLGELGGLEQRHHIVAALGDSSLLVSIVAARALCDPQSVDHLPEVLNRLARFQSWTPTFLASMLASAGSLGAHSLREALWNEDLNDTVRAIAAYALRDLNDFRAAGAAAHALARGGERILVVAALRLLGQVGQRKHLAIVLEKIDDVDFVVRVAAVDAVAALGAGPEMERLQRLLHHDPSRWVALHAARGLLEAGQVAALRALAHGQSARAPIGAQVLAEGGRR